MDSVNIKLKRILRDILFKTCDKCGSRLESVTGWSGKYRCPKEHHPKHHSNGLLPFTVKKSS